MRSITRIVGCSLNTVSKLIIDAGRAAESLHNQLVRHVYCERVQADEQWAFCYAKAKNVSVAAPPGSGDAWLWVAMDPDSKLIISWHLSHAREIEDARIFMKDLAGRLACRVQLTTDGLRAYPEAVEEAFGGDVDYGQLVKNFGGSKNPERRYSPGAVTSAIKIPVVGRPDKKYISTSLVERLNLTTRMSQRRYTRLTNGFSKKFSRHWASTALFMTWYNFGRRHGTVRQTPAQKAGLVGDSYDMAWILNRADHLSKALRNGGWYDGQIGF